jgi:hypothetical protein
MPNVTGKVHKHEDKDVPVLTIGVSKAILENPTVSNSEKAKAANDGNPVAYSFARASNAGIGHAPLAGAPERSISPFVIMAPGGYFRKLRMVCRSAVFGSREVVSSRRVRARIAPSWPVVSPPPWRLKWFPI